MLRLILAGRVVPRFAYLVVLQHRLASAVAACEDREVTGEKTSIFFAIHSREAERRLRCGWVRASAKGGRVGTGFGQGRHAGTGPVCFFFAAIGVDSTEFFRDRRRTHNHRFVKISEIIFRPITGIFRRQPANAFGLILYKTQILFCGGFSAYSL